jgi:hypothetical protein
VSRVGTGVLTDLPAEYMGSLHASPGGVRFVTAAQLFGHSWILAMVWAMRLSV